MHLLVTRQSMTTLHILRESDQESGNYVPREWQELALEGCTSHTYQPNYPLPIYGNIP